MISKDGFGHWSFGDKATSNPSETVPSRADKATQTTSQIIGIESNILSGILPGD